MAFTELVKYEELWVALPNGGRLSTKNAVNIKKKKKHISQ